MLWNVRFYRASASHISSESLGTMKGVAQEVGVWDGRQAHPNGTESLRRPGVALRSWEAGMFAENGPTWTNPEFKTLASMLCQTKNWPVNILFEHNLTSESR